MKLRGKGTPQQQVNVLQISKDRKIVASWWEDVGCIVAPAMLIDKFKFTGKTEF